MLKDGYNCHEDEKITIHTCFIWDLYATKSRQSMSIRFKHLSFSLAWCIAMTWYVLTLSCAYADHVRNNAACLACWTPLMWLPKMNFWC